MGRQGTRLSGLLLGWTGRLKEKYFNIVITYKFKGIDSITVGIIAI